VYSLLQPKIRTALDYVVMKNLLMAVGRRQISHTSFKDIMEQLQSSEQPIIIKILLEKNTLQDIVYHRRQWGIFFIFEVRNWFG